MVLTTAQFRAAMTHVWPFRRGPFCSAREKCKTDRFWTKGILSGLREGKAPHRSVCANGSRLAFQMPADWWPTGCVDQGFFTWQFLCKGNPLRGERDTVRACSYAVSRSRYDGPVLAVLRRETFAR